MLTFDDVLAEHLKDPEFRKEWEALAEEYQKESERIRAEIAAEEKAGIVRNPEAIAWIKDYKVDNA